MSDVKVVNQVSDEDIAAAAAAFSQEKEQETEAAEPARPFVRYCSLCGHDVEEPVEDITAEDKRNWLRYIEGAPIFAKTYDLFDGRIRVTLKGLSSAEVSVCAEVYDEIVRKKNFDLIADTNASYWYYKQLFLAMLKSIQQGDKVVFSRGDEPLTAELLQHMDASMFSKLNDWVATMYIDITRRFNRLVKQLTAAGVSPDFWRPTP